MKILIIHCGYKFRGGEDTVVQEEIKLLRSVGNTVKLLEFSNNSKALLKLLQLPFNFLSYTKTLKELDHFGPDLVHIHNLHFGASASVIYAVKRRKIPMVVTLHNFRLLCPSGTLFFDGHPFLDSLNENFCWSAIKKGVYQNSRLLTFWLSVSMSIHQKLKTWQLPDKYIVLTEHSKSLFSHSKLLLKEDQLMIKPNFSAPASQQASTVQDHFLFIGRLSKEKGIELLLETFAKSGYTLKIAGDGPFKEKVIVYSENYPNIQYLGILKKDTIVAELQSCSALVFPSIWYEGMPLTIIEAFACGVPVIASNIGAMETMIVHGYNGFHFEALNERDLEKQLKNWWILPQKEKEQYRANALNTYRQNYTPEKNAELLLAIYASVLPKKTGSSRKAAVPYSS